MVDEMDKDFEARKVHPANQVAIDAAAAEHQRQKRRASLNQRFGVGRQPSPTEVAAQIARITGSE